MQSTSPRAATLTENRVGAPSQKLAGIQMLRGIAALMVVCFHALVYDYAAIPNAVLPLWAPSGAAGVDLFFVISGFVMVHVTRDRFGSPTHQINFLLDRATRIYPPYWIATLPVIAVCLFLPWQTGIEFNTRTLADSLLLLPSRAAFPLLHVGWTLIHEIYFYAVFSFFLLGKREALGTKLAAWALVTAGLFLFLPQQWRDIPTLNLVSSLFTLEFIAGGLLALFPLPKISAWTGGVLLVGGFFVFLTATLALPFGWQNGYPLRPVVLGLPCSLIVAGAISLESRCHFFQWNVLQQAGNASFQIYLWHSTILSAIARTMFPGHMLPPHASLPLAAACAIGFSYLVHRSVEKPLLRTTRHWRLPIH